jgi:Cysteine-rich CWC
MSGGEAERQLLGTAPTLKSCAACGEEFSCGAPVAGCWCEDVQVAAEVLVALRARYADCLCRQCLTAAAASARDVSYADSESTSTGRNISPQHLL